MDDSVIKIITQKKLDSLGAKHLHVRARKKLNRYNLAADILAIAVPVLYFVPRYLLKGTQYGTYVEAGWECIAAVLIVLIVAKIACKWEERAQSHSKLLGENISLVRQADELLIESGLPDTVQLFLRLAEKSETADREVIGEPSDKDKRYAYREGLKELGDSSVRCDICGASPWKFKPGSCQLCGNTPIKMNA